MKARKLIIRIAAVVVLIVIGIIMSIIGRGHTIYLDNKTLEYEGQTYKAPYKVTVTVHGDRHLIEVQTYKIPVPKNMDGVIINIPGYLAGLPEEAYLTEFVPVVTEEPDEEDPSTGDDLIPGSEDTTLPDA